MMEKEFKVPLISLQQVKYPFVEGSFRAKNGKMLNGLFLVDTGSDNSIFNYKAKHLLGEDIISTQKQNVTAMYNEGEYCPIANIDIMVGDQVSNECFIISQNLDFEKKFSGALIIGVLGIQYLVKHKLILDLETEVLSDKGFNPDKDEAYSFFFPMEYGIKTYNIPIVGMLNNDKEYLLVADTGCDLSVMAATALKEGMLNYEITKERGIVEGIAGVKETQYADAKFELLSLGDEKGKTKLVPYNEIVQFVEENFIATHPDGETPPLSGLLSNEFMIRNKWILDFKYGVIYSTCPQK